MRKTLSFFLCALCVASVAIVLALAGCGSSTPISIVLSLNGTQNVVAGQVLNVTAQVMHDSKNAGVTWSLSPSSSAGTLSMQTTTSVSYTAPSPIASNGTATITATSVSNTSKTATVTINLQAVLVAVSPSSATVASGSTAPFTATVSNDPSTTPSVTWAVTCSVAQCGSVSPATTASGAATTYTAPSTPPTSALTVTITATSVLDTTKTNTATITVPPVSVSVAPTTATVLAGNTKQFTATVTNTSNTGVTWTVTCSVASCGTLNSPTANPVTYTAPATPPPSDLTVTITATSVADSTKKASATITIPAVTISVAPTAPTVLPGATQQFSATVMNTSNLAVTWSLTQGGAACTAACGTLSSSTANPVTYTPPTPAANLTVTITATSAADTTKSSSTTIMVPAITITVTPSSAQVAVSGFTAFTGTVMNDGASKGVTWALSQGGTACAPTCGTINAGPTPSGTGTTYQAPPSMLANPVVTVTGTSVTDPTKSMTATVTIMPVSVSVSPTTATVQVNQTKQFTATVTFDAHNLGVSWTITSGGTPCPLGCGSVSPSSSLSGVAVTYTAPSTVPAGPVTLTATSTTDSTKTASATITVTAASGILVAITQQPPSSMVAGTTASVTATVTNDTMTKGVDWTVTCGSPGVCGSFNPTHTASGTATTYTAPGGVPAGMTVTITATSTADTTKSASATVTITPPAITIVFTMAPPSSMVVSTTASVSVTLTNDTQGADWTVTCGSAGACGSFSPTHTASGAATTYTAPSAVPTGTTVTITATSTADTTKSVSGMVTITSSSTACNSGSESLLNGGYAFLLTGFDGSGNPALVGGVISVDGAGHVTAGTMDMNLSSGAQTSINVISGTFSVGSDHRGCMSLTTNSATNATQTFRFSLGGISGTPAVASTGHMINFDAAGPFTTGVLRRQSGGPFMNSSVSGSFAFGASGIQNAVVAAVCSGKLGVVGVADFDGINSITGGFEDVNQCGKLDGNSTLTTWPASPVPITGGTYSVSPNGHGMLTLTIAGITFHDVIFVVSSSEALFMVSDAQTAALISAGLALKQTGAGSFTNSSVSGPFAGYTSALGSAGAGTTDTELIVVNIANPNITGNVVGNDAGTISSMALSGITYAVAPSGRTLLSGAGVGTHAPLLLVVDANHVFFLNSNRRVNSGFFESQTSTSANGTYAFGAIDPEDKNISDDSGVASFASGNISITQDKNSSGTLTVGGMQSATFSVDSMGGIHFPSGCTTTCVEAGLVISPTRLAVFDLTSTNPKIDLADK